MDQEMKPAPGKSIGVLRILRAFPENHSCPKIVACACLPIMSSKLLVILEDLIGLHEPAKVLDISGRALIMHLKAWSSRDCWLEDLPSTE